MHVSFILHVYLILIDSYLYSIASFIGHLATGVINRKETASIQSEHVFSVTLLSNLSGIVPSGLKKGLQRINWNNSIKIEIDNNSFNGTAASTELK